MLQMFIPKAMYMFLPKLPGLKRTMRHSVTWMHRDLPVDPLWEPFFYNSMVYGSLINQVFPRVYSKDEFAQIKAKVLLILGERERSQGFAHAPTADHLLGQLGSAQEANSPTKGGQKGALQA